MKITFGPPDKHGEIMSGIIKITLKDSPMCLDLNINGKVESWYFTFVKTRQGIGPKVGDAVNGRITNVSHRWGKESADGKHVILDVIGVADNSGNAELQIWGSAK